MPSGDDFRDVYPGTLSILSKSKSKKTLFQIGPCKPGNISFHLKWVLVAGKSMRIIKIQQNLCNKITGQKLRYRHVEVNELIDW